MSILLAILQLSLTIPAQEISEPEPLVVGLFVASMEEGARVFTPVRLLPFEHPDAYGHEFPNAPVNHTSEVQALVGLDLTRAEFLEGLNMSAPDDMGDGCRIMTYPGPWSRASLPAGAQERQSSEPEEDAVLEVVRSFKQSLRAGDTEGVLDVLHPDVRIYEGGHAETKEDYSQGHLQADMEFLQAVETTVISEQAVVRGELAFYLSEWTGKGEFRGRPVDLHGTETLILVRTPAGWKIRHVHWSSR